MKGCTYADVMEKEGLGWIKGLLSEFSQKYSVLYLFSELRLSS